MEDIQILPLDPRLKTHPMSEYVKMMDAEVRGMFDNIMFEHNIFMAFQQAVSFKYNEKTYRSTVIVSPSLVV